MILNYFLFLYNTKVVIFNELGTNSKKNTIPLEKRKNDKITKYDYMKSYYQRMPLLPNRLPITHLIYFFRLICKNYNICLGLSYDLSRHIFPFLNPTFKIFSDYSEKIIYKNTTLNTPFGVIFVDKIVCSSRYKYGYDIVSTLGLSEKIVGNYYRNKYFNIKLLSDDGINIEFYNHLNSYWTTILELSSPILWGLRFSNRFEMWMRKNCNFSTIAKNLNFETFLEKLKNIENTFGFKFNEYTESKT